LNRKFWKGRRVLVTGHTGFKGSWLSLWLQSAGADVSGFALPPPTDPGLFESAGVGRGMRSMLGDIRDQDSFERAFDASTPEIVLHLAAQPLVRASYADPVGTWATNVIGTVHLLEAVRRHPSVRAVVNVTSDKCYENREWDRAYREDDPLGGRDPYSSSKAGAEIVTSAWRRSFFGGNGAPAVATARAGNTIGGGDWAMDRLVPDVLEAFRAGRPVKIRNPDAVRPWQHVLDAVGGYLILGERLYEEGASFAEAWNFGPDGGDVRTVRSVVERLVSLWGAGARWEPDPDRAAQPPEAGLLQLDSAKARARLGWAPRLALDEGLAWTAQWHRGYARGVDMAPPTLAQIERWERLGRE
jgi:CDP-glucose 4,6-dehydratase